MIVMVKMKITMIIMILKVCFLKGCGKLSAGRSMGKESAHMVPDKGCYHHHHHLQRALRPHKDKNVPDDPCFENIYPTKFKNWSKRAFCVNYVTAKKITFKWLRVVSEVTFPRF